jgi:hypothetical protein
VVVDGGGVGCWEGWRGGSCDTPTPSHHHVILMVHSMGGVLFFLEPFFCFVSCMAGFDDVMMIRFD